MSTPAKLRKAALTDIVSANDRIRIVAVALRRNGFPSAAHELDAEDWRRIARDLRAARDDLKAVADLADYAAVTL
jgi:hypothetical protein